MVLGAWLLGVGTVGMARFVQLRTRSGTPVRGAGQTVTSTAHTEFHHANAGHPKRWCKPPALLATTALVRVLDLRGARGMSPSGGGAVAFRALHALTLLMRWTAPAPGIDVPKGDHHRQIT